MSKLEEYYQFIDNLKNGRELSDEQKALYKRIEEEIILDEVLVIDPSTPITRKEYDDFKID